jgi:hypothetical protein
MTDSLIVRLKSLRDEFWEQKLLLKIDKRRDHWLWKGTTLSAGKNRQYGVTYKPPIMIKGKVKHGKHGYAHRIVYEYVKGPIPKNIKLRQTCGVSLCVHPDHWEPISHHRPASTIEVSYENMVRIGTDIIKRNAKIVKERLEHPDRSLAEIGAKYGISRQRVEQIIKQHSK